MLAMLPERRRTLPGACRSACYRASNFPKGRTEAQLEHACEIYHPNRSATAPVERLCRSAPLGKRLDAGNKRWRVIEHHMELIMGIST
jgi:hypothetical protein